MKLKKPKFWDLEKPSIISYILIPFTLILQISNFLQKFWIKNKNEKMITVCIGNIYLGGTGKTPTTIKVYEILKKLNLKVAVGKKFYSSQEDEKILLEKNTNLIINNNRKNIVKIAVKNRNDVLIFDDGLQDKSLNYNINIVCFDALNWIGNGLLIPAGPLREKLISLKKYDCIFLKNGSSNNKVIIKSIRNINKKMKIFYTYFKVLNLKKLRNSKKYLIFSGIGNPNNFKRILLDNNFNISKEIIYPDHFNYKKTDIDNIKNQAKKIRAKIITTEKDYVKISKSNQKDIHFLKVKLNIKNERTFINYLKTKIYAKN